MKYKSYITSILSLITYTQALAQQNLNSDAYHKITVDSVRLKEIVVKSTRPSSRLSTDGLITTIKGTVLQKLGTARDVLGFIPVIISQNESITVIGKGTPDIYINNRLVRNAHELDQLRSQDIKAVKVIHNPGARYKADTNAVIKIYTEKKAGDGFSVNNHTAFGIQDYLYGTEDFDINYRNKGLDIFGSISYSRRKNNGTSNNLQNLWGQSHSLTEIGMNSQAHSKRLEAQGGFNYTLNNHTFGLYYEFMRNPTRTASLYNSNLFNDNHREESITSHQNQNSVTQTHLIDGYYTGLWNKWSLNATWDLLWKNTDQKQNAKELSDLNEEKSVSTCDLSNGRLLAGKVELAHPLWNGGTVSFGTEYTYSIRNDNFQNIEGIISNNRNAIHESNASLYAEFIQRLHSVSFQLGVRYEHITSNYFEKDEKINEQSRKYNQLFPSAMILIPFKTSMLQLSYTRKYNRPLYSQLSSTVTYINRYLYESGNPLLRPSYYDNASLMFKFRWLTLMADYKHVTDQILSECTSYEGRSNITLLKKKTLHTIYIIFKS